MEAFNKQIQEIEIQVDKLSGRLVNLKNLLRDANEESKSVTKTSEIIAIKKRMEKYINDVGNIARNVNGKLQVITIDILLLRQMPGRQKGTASDRARMNMTNVLTKKLKELMIEFEVLREIVQDEYREVVERRLMTAVTGSSPDELLIDHLIETGISEQTFPNAFEQMGQGKVVSTMEEIQERLDAVKELEKRLLELHQIYLKTAAVVEGQAKPLDNIENQVGSVLPFHASNSLLFFHLERLAVTVCLLATPNPILIVCYLNLIRTTFICSTCLRLH
ncbi:syntaxin-132-like isoform X3 [Cucurbita moschata]|uniref:Syntaxin-132-like isoform X3 n=1 Tax=Cucurbita moschata TaxID=3662 RepID=A0A6J1G8F4_CUCMO|nr:syntaxin-132-like isoform X3 [Cucurbita moschata]